MQNITSSKAIIKSLFPLTEETGFFHVLLSMFLFNKPVDPGENILHVRTFFKAFINGLNALFVFSVMRHFFRGKLYLFSAYFIFCTV